MSGTNGKTTTTRLLAAALGGQERSPPPGQVRTCRPVSLRHWRGSAGSQTAVLEVDEAYLARIPRCGFRRGDRVAQPFARPARPGERGPDARRALARRRGIDARTVTVVANADDPLVAWAAGAGSGSKVRFVVGAASSGTTTRRVARRAEAGSCSAKPGNGRATAGSAARVPYATLTARRPRDRRPQTSADRPLASGSLQPGERGDGGGCGRCPRDR